MDFEKVVRKRRSIRRFTGRKVPLELVKKLVEDATYAPTPCNQQLWKFIAITDDAIKSRLVKEAYSSTIVGRAPLVLVGCYDAWHKKEAVQAASLATQNMLLSATNNNLGSLSMNSFGNEKRVKKILNIPKNYSINSFVLLGYPAETERKAQNVTRRHVDEVLSVNIFSSEHTPKRSYNTGDWTKEKLVDYQKYYCRKTFPGKSMDIMDVMERQLVKNALSKGNGRKIIDFFSYDGSMLELFPSQKITSVNLDENTEAYVKEAVNLYCPEKSMEIGYASYNSVTGENDRAYMIFKAERLPHGLRLESLSKAHHVLKENGELVIISRLPSALFSLFYYPIIFLFGDDVRKTGIYAFWGPYKPLGLRKIKKELKGKGFKVTFSKKYFIMPPFFNQALQMLIQYVKSGGSSYLHRASHNNFFTKALEFMIKIQGSGPLPFGSVAIIRARKIK